MYSFRTRKYLDPSPEKCLRFGLIHLLSPYCLRIGNLTFEIILINNIDLTSAYIRTLTLSLKTTLNHKSETIEKGNETAPLFMAVAIPRARGAQII